MTWTRPHEDRLGTGGAVGRTLQYTGTGIAAWGFGGGVVVYAECNTPPTLANESFDFDTFYDVNQSPAALPAALGLSYAAGAFTFDEDGLWMVNVFVLLAAAPGEDGKVSLYVPNYSVAPYVNVTAAQASYDWAASYLVVGLTGQGFGLQQVLTGDASAATYANMDIVRIAGSVS